MYCSLVHVAQNSILISIVMPLYNMEAFLAVAIDSILSQTHENLEIVVVDDGSTDQSALVAKSYRDERVRYFYQENSGVSAARNFGILQSRGSYIAFVDPDDICLPNKLQVQIDEMTALGIECAGTLMFYLSKRGRLFGVCGEQSLTRLGEIASGSLMPFALSSIMVKREILLEVGLFDERFNSTEDHELLSRIAKKHKIFTVMNRLGGYRVHNLSASSDGFLLQGVLSKYVEEIRRAESSFSEVIDMRDFIAMKLEERSFIKILIAKHYFRQAGNFFISRK